jgi:deoxyribonuclease V
MAHPARLQLESLHRWDVTPREAIAIQQALRSRVSTRDPAGRVRLVAGIDVGYEDAKSVTRAAVVVLSFPGLELLEQSIARRPTTFPYVPGLLSFREVPAVIDALRELSHIPDLLVCDGQGYAHPRRFGLACHLGVLTGIRAIGVAKTRLVGTHQPVPEARGEWQPLVDDEEIIGAVLRTRADVKPVYVSVGHRVSLQRAIAYTLECTPRYRLPETTRLAHRLASGHAPLALLPRGE